MRVSKKKQEKALENMMNLLKQAGVDEEVLAKAKDSVPEPKDAVTLQGEAVLIYLEKPARFTQKRCKWCDETFGTNYRNVSYCSDDHRAKAILASTGLAWNYNTAVENRLQFDPALTIPPAHIEQLRKFCRAFMDQYENQDEQPKIVAGQVIPFPTPVPALGSSSPEPFDLSVLPSFG